MEEGKRKEVIAKAVERAQEVARCQGLRIGQTVAHPTDPVTHSLSSVCDGLATVQVAADGSFKTYPLCELFDPNEALRIAMNIKNEMERECLRAAGLR